MLNEAGFLDLVVNGKIFDWKQFVERHLWILFNCPVDKLLFPIVICRIEGHRFESHTETEGALLVFKIFVLNSDVDILNLYL